MKGYWRRDDETQKTIINGWLHTGDIAIVDSDGYIRIVDRKKDMIIVSGFNVYPNEIENVMHTNFKFMQDSIASDSQRNHAGRSEMLHRQRCRLVGGQAI